MMTTPTHYPRIPELEPRAQGEGVEAYGLRALRFILATDCTVTVDTEGLTLAHYVFPLAVSGHELSPVAAERLASAQARITGTLRRRQAEQDACLEALQASSAPAGEDKPNLGPGAPLRPAPVVPPAPSAALQAPVDQVDVDQLRNPARIAQALTVPASQAPQAPSSGRSPFQAPQAPAFRFQPTVRPVAVPSVPKVSEAEWGF